MNRDQLAAILAVLAGAVVTVLAAHGVITATDAETLSGAVAACLVAYHVPNKAASDALNRPTNATVAGQVATGASEGN